MSPGPQTSCGSSPSIRELYTWSNFRLGWRDWQKELTQAGGSAQPLATTSDKNRVTPWELPRLVISVFFLLAALTLLVSVVGPAGAQLVSGLGDEAARFLGRAFGVMAAVVMASWVAKLAWGALRAQQLRVRALCFRGWELKHGLRQAT